MRTHDSYHSVRDAEMRQPTCSHGKSSFRETWEPQPHICRKSCPVFDPTLQPTGSPCHDPKLQDALRAGRVIEMLHNLQHPEDRLRFTLSCCTCGLSHSRVADITRHLQTQRGPFFRAADEYVVLIEEQQQNCVCNPQRPSQPRSHRCVAWRQIAMIEHFLNPDHRFFFPDLAASEDEVVRCSPALPVPWLHSPVGLMRLLLPRVCRGR